MLIVTSGCTSSSTAPTSANTPSVVPNATAVEQQVPPTTSTMVPDTVVPTTLSATATRVPTPVSTAFPARSTPFEEATVTPSGMGDLQPFFGNGQPVRVRNPDGGRL